MADEALKTLLCLPGKHRNYAVEFPYAEEICKDMMISLMPSGTFCRRLQL